MITTLSSLQYSVLKAIRRRGSSEHLKVYKQGTIGSLLYRGLVSGSAKSVELTSAGADLLLSYEQLSLAKRKATDGLITERVMALLNGKVNGIIRQHVGKRKGKER